MQVLWYNASGAEQAVQFDDEPPLHWAHEAAQGWHDPVAVAVHVPRRYWPAAHESVHAEQLEAPVDGA